MYNYYVLDPNSNDDGVTKKYISVPENQKADNAEYVIWKSMGGSKYKEYVKLPPKSDHALFISYEQISEIDNESPYLIKNEAGDVERIEIPIEPPDLAQNKAEDTITGIEVCTELPTEAVQSNFNGFTNLLQPVMNKNTVQPYFPVIENLPARQVNALSVVSLNGQYIFPGQSQPQVNPIFSSPYSYQDTEWESKQKPSYHSKPDKGLEEKNPYEMMRELIQTERIVIADGGLFIFTNSMYECLTEEKAKILILKRFRKEIADIGLPHYVKYIYEFLKMEPDIVINTKTDPNLLAFVDGVLHLDTWEFEANKNFLYFVTSYITTPYTLYQKNFSLECPCFDQFVWDIAQGDAILIRRIWEIIGYYLTTDMAGKCFILLQGPGNTGKSIFGEFLTGFFNKEACSYLNMNQLGERFSSSLIVGKRINASFDLPAESLKPAAVAMIKMITGGDKITVEVKYQNPFSYQPQCKLIFSSNFPLCFNQNDTSFWDRVRVIPFMHQIPPEKQDKRLLDKLERERACIIKKALAAYCKLKENNYIFSGGNDYGLQINQSSQFIPQASWDINQVDQFINLCCDFVSKEQGKTFTKILYEAFENYCSKMGIPNTLDQTSFSSVLRERYRDRVRANKWRDKNYTDGSLRGYEGIVLKPNIGSILEELQN